MELNLTPEIVRGRTFMRGEGKVTLRLAPEQLGHVRVDLAVRSRSVEATLTAETERARQLLGESVEQLRAALEARGLSVERIVLAEAAQDARTEGGFGAAADGEGGNAARVPEDEGEATAVMRRAASSRRSQGG